MIKYNLSKVFILIGLLFVTSTDSFSEGKKARMCSLNKDEDSCTQYENCQWVDYRKSKKEESKWQCLPKKAFDCSSVKFSEACEVYENCEMRSYPIGKGLAQRLCKSKKAK